MKAFVWLQLLSTSNEICWLLQKVPATPTHGFNTNEEFINKRFSRGNILRWERMFDKDFVSNGGLETTEVCRPCLLLIAVWIVPNYLGSVVELRWDPRGPAPPERPGGLHETSVLRGFKGAVKGPWKLQDDHSSFVDALLQFAICFFVLKLQ